MAEGGWGVGESEIHDGGFIKAKRHFEGGFPVVFFLDTYVVVSPVDVHFSE